MKRQKDERTERRKGRKTKSQKYKKTQRRKDRKTKRQKEFFFASSAAAIDRQNILRSVEESLARLQTSCERLPRL